MMIWLTTPTAATLLSEWRLNINVSTAPNIIINNVSIKIGAANLASLLLTLSCFILCATADSSSFIGAQRYLKSTIKVIDLDQETQQNS